MTDPTSSSGPADDAPPALQRRERTHRTAVSPRPLDEGEERSAERREADAELLKRLLTDLR